jgi:hypothetical protein
MKKKEISVFKSPVRLGQKPLLEDYVKAGAFEHGRVDRGRQTQGEQVRVDGKPPSRLSPMAEAVPRHLRQQRRACAEDSARNLVSR